MLKNILKFSFVGLGIAAVGAAAIYGVDYWRYKTSPEYQLKQEYERMEKAYAEDMYGGNTPEETLQLFIDALKKGDTNLAAKYFVLDRQEEQRLDLAKMKQKNLLDEMIKDLKKTKSTVKSDTAYFTLIRENDLPSELIMHKNSLTNKWKIIEL